ncbi:MAG TPA: lamin tail domain-containing protein, partial [Planctomycetota bacterium]|nr:lamin tail domain-containing protein [Planctomycetota bacterium]
MLALVSSRAQAVITITEIMYHPAGGGRDLEYIELHNETPDPMDLTGYFFRAGIDFTFTERTFLDPGAYIVVCANKEAIRAKYGIENVVGDWSPDTALDNGGEAVELANPGGLVESRVQYNDRGKWPSGADGTGHSLELEYVYTNTDDPDRWALSGVLGGSPGKPNDTAIGAMPVFVNEAFLIGAERWVEIYNGGTEAVNLTGYHLTDDRANLSRGTLPAVVLEPRAFITFTETALGLNLAPDGNGRTFIALVSPGGDRVIDARLFRPEPGVSEARIPDGNAQFSSFADP